MQSIVRVRSSASVKIISLDAETLLARLRDKAREAVRLNSKIISVWLFGSLARGQALPGSDADVLIVLARSEVEFRRRIDEFSDTFGKVGAPVDVLPVTVIELEERKDEPFWRQVLQERILLAGEDT